MDFPPHQEQAPPIDVPYTELSESALLGVIEAFVLREGTEYGEKDVPLERKVADIMRQLERGEAQIVFDPNTESVDIVVKRSPWRSQSSPGPT